MDYKVTTDDVEQAPPRYEDDGHNAGAVVLDEIATLKGAVPFMFLMSCTETLCTNDSA